MSDLTTRDALAQVIGEHQPGEWRQVRPAPAVDARYGRFCSCGYMLDIRDLNGSHRAHLADALASGAVIDAATLADDEALVNRIGRAMLAVHDDPDIEYMDDCTLEVVRAALTELDAALSERAS